MTAATTPEAITDARVRRAPHVRFERCESCRTLVATSANTDDESRPSLIERWHRPLAWEDDGVLRSAAVHTPEKCRRRRAGGESR